MKQILIVGLLAMFSGFFACNTQSNPTIADVPQIQPNQESEPINTKNKQPVLVELFTSQGCSSCPPADRVLTQLETEQSNPNAEIITLSLHVDYWDRIGWKDPFSSALFSQRQAVYGQAFNLGSNYTPQMVVDGQKEFVGSSMENAKKAITDSTKTVKATVELQSAENSLKVKISDIPKHENATIFLAVAEDNLSSNVTRGENSGKKLAHTSVVRELKSIGLVTAQQNSFATEATVQIQPDWKKENLKFVVFVQENGTRKILGVNRTGAM